MNPVVGVVLLPPPSLRLDDSVVVLRYVSDKHGDTFRSAEVARRYGVSRTTLYKHVGVITPRQ